MSWILLELTSHPDLQEELRVECAAQSLPDASAGNAPLDSEALRAFDHLPLLDAVVRETLRVHSPVGSTIRAAVSDDRIPLAAPYTDRHGVVHDGIEYFLPSPPLLPPSNVRRVG
jgi:hypothetical protein